MHIHFSYIFAVYIFAQQQQQQSNNLGEECAEGNGGAEGESIINNFISCQAKRQQMRGLVKRLCVCVCKTNTHKFVYKLNKKCTKIVMLRH